MSPASPEGIRVGRVAALALSCGSLVRSDRAALYAELVALGWTGGVPATPAEARAAVERLRADAVAARAAAMRADAAAGMRTGDIAARHGVAPSTARAATAGVVLRRGGPVATTQEKIREEIRRGGPARIDQLAMLFGVSTHGALTAMLARGELVASRVRGDRGWVRIVGFQEVMP